MFACSPPPELEQPQTTIFSISIAQGAETNSGFRHIGVRPAITGSAPAVSTFHSFLCLHLQCLPVARRPSFGSVQTTIFSISIAQGAETNSGFRHIGVRPAITGSAPAVSTFHSFLCLHLHCLPVARRPSLGSAQTTIFSISIAQGAETNWGFWHIGVRPAITGSAPAVSTFHSFLCLHLHCLPVARRPSLGSAQTTIFSISIAQGAETNSGFRHIGVCPAITGSAPAVSTFHSFLCLHLQCLPVARRPSLSNAQITILSISIAQGAETNSGFTHIGVG